MIIRAIGPYTHKLQIEIQSLRDSQINTIDDCVDEVNGEITIANRKPFPDSTITWAYYKRLGTQVRKFISKIYLTEGWKTVSWKGRTITLTR